MSKLLTNEPWAEAQQKEFAEPPGAVLAFWPEVKRAFLDLTALEPAKSHVIVAAEDVNPHMAKAEAEEEAAKKETKRGGDAKRSKAA
jgi:hypothetical protein